MLAAFLCTVAWVADGDTMRCRGGQLVRLAGIDAPERGACPRWRRCVEGNGDAARRALIALARNRTFRCAPVGRSYNRVVAWCSADGRDLSCTMVAAGAARPWPRYWQPARCRPGR
ncbi:MAG: thermonuclease family protein [Sphingomonas sp.]